MTSNTDPKERTESTPRLCRRQVEQLQGLPPALIQVAESDILAATRRSLRA